MTTVTPQQPTALSTAIAHQHTVALQYNNGSIIVTVRARQSLCSEAEPRHYSRATAYRDLGNHMLFSARVFGLLLPALIAEGCAAFHGKPAAPNIIRQPLEVDDPAFPVAGGVMTRTGTDTVYLAGLLPSI